MKSLLALVFLVVSPVFATTYFDDVESRFASAPAAVETTVKGYWGGDCSTVSEPSIHHPAVLVVKNGSMSYFYERKTNTDFFRRMDPDAVENYQPVKDWFAKEQWNPLHSLAGSLSNEYKTAYSPMVRRDLRWEESQFSRQALLRVVRINGVTETTTLYCSFEKYLGASTTTPSPRINDSFLVANTGYMNNQLRVMDNADPTRPVDRLLFLNRGTTSVMLRDIAVKFEDGSLGMGPASIQLPARMGFELKRNPLSPPKITKVQVGVVGVTSGIEIRAYETP